jgi:hypothetical protein
MKLFEIEGRSLLSWKMTVPARSEREALEQFARRISECVDPGAGPTVILGLDHRLLRCDLFEAGELFH